METFIAFSIAAGLVCFAVWLVKLTFKLQDRVYKDTSEYRANAKGKIFCPNCGCTDLSAHNRGYSTFTGSVGSKDVYITCLKCGHRWKAGNYNYLYKDENI